MRLSESFDYELQLKPYAHIYDEFKKQKKILKEEEAKELASKLCKDKTQFHQINLNNQKLISPYVPFFEDKYDKFRKYLENDDLHTCVEQDEFVFNAEWDFESSSSESSVNYDEEEEEAQEGNEAEKSKEESNNQNSVNDKKSEEGKDQDESNEKKEIKEDNEEEIKLKEENKEANGNKEETSKKDENLEGEKQGEEKKPEEKKEEEKKDGDDPECDNFCDIFRNIDKLRLIEKSIDELANINLIKKHPDFNDSFYLRNYFQYQKRMGEKLLFLLYIDI